jgi:2-polyprenyl-3-methyl-5-hydroxy-6-metoxy-1,4-benzoquinol methylase
MKKVICISHFKDFCLHHLPNKYVNLSGHAMDQLTVNNEITKLMLLDNDNIGALFKGETELENNNCWDKQYYESAREDVLSMVPPKARTVLSVGCGCGKTEGKLVQRGIKVVAIPMDCVIAVTAQARGIEIMPPNLLKARERLSERRFDCIIFSDSLHRFENPILVLKDFIPLLEAQGRVIVTAPNTHFIGTLRNRVFGYMKLPIGLRSSNVFFRYGMHLTTFHKVRQWLQKAGLDSIEIHSVVAKRHRFIDMLSFGLLRPLLAKNLIFVGKRRKK